MSDNLDQTLDLMKREIDALQIAVTGSKTPWYKNISLMVSVIALMFSFGTTYVSYRRTAAQDIQSTRQELRGLLQRLAALPKEGVDISKKYSSDPAAMALVSGFLNQENALLARQAAEFAKKLPVDSVSGTEYYAIAIALQNSYDLAGVSEFLKYSIQAAKDFNTEIAALRMTANLQFIQGHPESGRVEYQKALDIFSKYPGYDAFTKTTTNVWTELAWATSEANVGLLSLANQHVENAEGILNGLPPSPGVNSLRAQVSQAKEQYDRGTRNINTAAGSQLGVAPSPRQK